MAHEASVVGMLVIDCVFAELDANLLRRASAVVATLYAVVGWCTLKLAWSKLLPEARARRRFHFRHGLDQQGEYLFQILCMMVRTVCDTRSLKNACMHFSKRSVKYRITHRTIRCTRVHTVCVSLGVACGADRPPTILTCSLLLCVVMACRSVGIRRGQHHETGATVFHRFGGRHFQLR